MERERNGNVHFVFFEERERERERETLNFLERSNPWIKLQNSLKVHLSGTQYKKKFTFFKLNYDSYSEL